MNLHDLPAEAQPTKAQLRALEAQAFRDHQQAQWERETVSALPFRWGKALLRQHAARKLQGLPEANRALLDITTRIHTKFDGCRLEPGATHDDICHRAEQFAQRCERTVLRWKQPEGARREIDALCRAAGIEPPDHELDAQVIARAIAPDWWRRALTKVHARTLEACAIELGYVHRYSGLYISDETFARRQQQRKRNADILAGTDAISEDGEIVPMEEIEKGSLANKAIRRAELMTRAKGTSPTGWASKPPSSS